MCFSNIDHQAGNSVSQEPEQLLPLPSPHLWTGREDRSVNITLTAALVRQHIAEATNDQEKASRGRLFTSLMEYAKPQLLTQYQNLDILEEAAARQDLDILEEVTDSIKKWALVHPRSPIQDHMKRGQDNLLIIADEIINKQDLPRLGPQYRKPKKADDGSRFVCVFDHELFKTASDLRRHLNKDHTRKVVDGFAKQQQMMDERHVEILTGKELSEESRLRVFGPYTYEDVLDNGWSIKNWNEREPRGPTAAPSLRSQTTGSSKPAGKRKVRQRSHEESDERYTRNGPPQTPTSTTRSRSQRPSLSSRHISSVSTMPSSVQSWFQATGLSPLDPRLENSTPASEHLYGQDLLGVEPQIEPSTPSNYPAEVSMTSVEPALPLKRILFQKAGERNFRRGQT